MRKPESANSEPPGTDSTKSPRERRGFRLRWPSRPDLPLRKRKAPPSRTPSWIDLEGLANMRDLGGTPAAGGVVRPGRLLRSDNLQDLTPDDVARLEKLGLTDVIDLRSAFEVFHEGPTPVSDLDWVGYHNYSFMKEFHGEEIPEANEDLPGKAVPWQHQDFSVQVSDPVTSSYLSFLADRPDSVLRALRTIASAKGAALVHCAAGKDRTGTAVALALTVAGVPRSEIVADYVATSERIGAVIARLRGGKSYDELAEDVSVYRARPEVMEGFFDYLDAEFGGALVLLERLGWTEEDSAALASKLLDE